jgi:hypothetical protein
MRGNGFVLPLWGGAAGGALLPFICNVKAAVDGALFPIGCINGGNRFISLLVGFLLAGLALRTRYRPVFRQRITIASLVVCLLRLAGYCLFTLVDIADITVQTSGGPARYSWDPSIGALLSTGGCAACGTAAIVMLRTGLGTERIPARVQLAFPAAPKSNQPAQNGRGYRQARYSRGPARGLPARLAVGHSETKGE